MKARKKDVKFYSTHKQKHQSFLKECEPRVVLEGYCFRCCDFNGVLKQRRIST